MAQTAPFQPWRYSEKAGKPEDLVTQPYDKITPAMQTRYLAQSPYNLVRVLLGERFDTDDDTNNVYTRASGYLDSWMKDGILVRDAQPAFYAYFQEFSLPGTGEKLTRKGFIGLGAVENYENGVVHRHEQTLSGPKKDRRQLLEATHAHFGHIFMLYADPERRVDALLDEAARTAPVVRVEDEYGTKHTLYRIAETERVEQIQQLMSDKKLLIADGHHRYETALAFRNEHPEIEDAKWVMMTFVNMHSPGLRILATHRVIDGLADFDPEAFLQKAASLFRVSQYDSVKALAQEWEQPALNRIRIGVVHNGGHSVHMLERDREPGALDVEVLHRELIEDALGISPEAVREQQFLRYIRGVDAAVDAVAEGEAQIAFLLEATTAQQVADSAFGGQCMPQKSTDFYPKLLSGLTIYRLEK